MRIGNKKLLRPEKAACSAALFTAAGAVACGVCCILPIALPAISLAGAGSIFGWFARAQFWMTAIACLAVGIAWVWIGLQSFRAKAKPARVTLFSMGVATLVLLLAILWSRIEPHVMRLLAMAG